MILFFQNLLMILLKKIENEVVYPGQIKVLVVRESKALGYAK